MFFKSWFVNSGSPPQVRGKRWRNVDKTRIAGITPAGAGKTSRRRRRKQHHGDHPRRCGENPVLHDFRAVGTGSPPQVRGKHPALSRRIFPTRITPAGAGKTSARHGIGQNGQDHPRRCGENLHGKAFRGWRRGSPPQVRGKLLYLRYILNCERITPAGAGKTARQICNMFQS